jgi:hypothetical protein
VNRLAALTAVALLTACGKPAPEPAPKKEATAAKITNFYTSTPEVELGEPALLCYSASDTPWVRLDPPVEQLTPSLSRCFSVKPEKTTTYRLLVPGDEKSVEVTVKPASKAKQALKPTKFIRVFVADATTAKPGQSVTLCYGFVNTASATLDPGGRNIPITEQRCESVPVQATTTFKLTATGKDGTTESKSLTVTVN